MSNVSSLTSPGMNAADYPRTYRASGGWATLLAVMAMILLSSGFLAWYFVFALEKASPAQRFMGGMVFGGLFLGGFYLFLLVVRFEITLRHDAIELQSAAFSRRLNRDEILGWRYIEGRTAVPSICLTPRQALHSSLQFPVMFRRDSAFDSWLNTFPNLDEADLQQSQDEITNNEELGLTREARLETLSQAKRLALALNAIGWGSLLWSAAYPKPLQLMVLVLSALPWFALYTVSRSKGVLRIDRPRKKDPNHPHVAYAIVMPGFGLVFRSMSDAHVLEWKNALWLAVAIGLALWFVGMATDRSLSARRGTLLALLLPAMFYGYGAGMGFNTAFDPSTATIYSARIISKNVVRGRHTDYNLVLEPWGPRRENSTVSVSFRLYNSVEIGDAVCLPMRSGALHIAWYEVVACQ